MRNLVVPAMLLALAGCGQQADLQRLEGTGGPATPYGAAREPSTEELLAPDTLAAPERSVELRRRSEEREDDPFDLPPE